MPLEHYPPSLKYFIVIFTTCTHVLLITSENSYPVYESLHFSFKWFALDMNVWSEVVASNNFPLSTETVLMNDIASFTLSEKGTTILLEWVGLRKQCCRLLCLHKFSHSKTSGHIVAWWRRMLTKKALAKSMTKYSDLFFDGSATPLLRIITIVASFSRNISHSK